MSKRTKIIIVLVLALLILLALWYMRPRSLDSILELEERTITDMSVSAMLIEDSWDASGVYWPEHRFFAIRNEAVDADAVLEMLRTSRYSYTLRSLFSPSSANLDTDYGIVTVSMILDGSESATLTISTRATLSLPGRSGMAIARCDGELYSLLKDYIVENGVEE